MSTKKPAFLFSFLLDGNGGAAEPDTDSILRWTSGDPPLWLHFDVGDAAACDWLQTASGLPDLAIENLLAEETRPRTIIFEQGLLVVLRGVNTNPGENPEDMVSIRIWIEADRVISTRRRKLLSVVDIAEALRAGQGPETTGGLLAMIVERLATRIGTFVDAIETRIDEAEAEIEDSHVVPTRQRLAWLDEGDSQALYQEADRITRYLEDLDLARERTILLKDDLTSQIAEQQNSRMYVLSIVAAIFLPLSFITGLLGMNVGGLPGVDDSRGFLISVLAMVAAVGGFPATDEVGVR